MKHTAYLPLALLSLTMGATATAEPLIQVSFTGTVTGLDIQPGYEAAFNAAFTVGDSVAFDVIYDAGLPQSVDAVSNVDSYSDAIVSVSGNVNGYAVSAVSPSISILTLTNDSISTLYGDHFSIDSAGDSFTGDVIAGATPGYFGVQFTDTDATLFPGAAIDPLPPLSSIEPSDFSQFDVGPFGAVDYYIGETYVAEVLFETTSISAQTVPEPTSLALLGLGGLLVSRRRR
jgi:hypothetical protein